ncbi:threonine/serine exporter family protein [Legionella sp. PATHC035]|uniref:threonine/serine ThrE exporter family protein n=1 Tax=Legionella sp. PATHC035 TaxID=2992040 RepID=UPI0022431769|nr:threonine/serine exporter family protein [Legionella sp. PATHC035]MCW8408824.1 threonine/serine exporter family protein [Legionella sp. PATHC035]
MSQKNDPSASTQSLTLAKQAEIILAFAKVLFVNGQTTTQVIREVRKIARVVNLNVLLGTRWGELWLHVTEPSGAQFECIVVTEPASVHMGKVIAARQTLDAFYQGTITLEHAYETLLQINRQPPSKTWLFTLAAAMGAVALGVIFGLNEWSAACLIFLSAALGAVTRRYLATITPNLFVQPLVAAGIAGVVGAIAVDYHLSSSLRLVALCPCMVLVPGPHFLNSALDFIHSRLHLGIARLTLAGLICVSISLGVLLGTTLLGASLPVEPITHQIVPLWQDMIAAGIAIIAYSIFFSTPLKLIVWPMIVGVLAHMLRWQALVSFGASIATASFLACFLVGIVLTLVAYKQRMPFAALAFAAVVSMIPGVYLFRMASGMVALTNSQHITFTLLSQTIYDGLNAVVITLAISIGLLGPKVILDKMATKYPKLLPSFSS